MMLKPVVSPQLSFPHRTPPAPGQTLEVAPGLLWLRLALPFRLDHVNVYLVEDAGGWAVIDTGIDDAATRTAWEALLKGLLARVAITRILVTHYHPDHIGLAGWLCERFGLPLLISQTEYLVSLAIHLDPGALNSEPYRSFYRSHGLDADTTERLLTNGHRYLRMISGLPRTFRRLIAGERLPIGSRRFEVLSGGGHAPEQVMLYCRADNMLLCADQILAKITPNISVQAMDPEGDPLGIYLRSLTSLERDMPGDVLVLPGHNLPFVGLHQRIEELRDHHEARCRAIEDACRRAPQTAADLVPVVFRRPIDDPHQMGFAFSEVLAHVNYMLREARLEQVQGSPGGVAFSARGRA
ncbi:MAG TPA: MBL fold metallo-hydrolase [Xanthobacteraceae bacterium]|jgi:glyoxylase-like metal-dependent hydrolase (beta-lactamase superfamily II)